MRTKIRNSVAVMGVLGLGIALGAFGRDLVAPAVASTAKPAPAVAQVPAQAPAQADISVRGMEDVITQLKGMKDNKNALQAVVFLELIKGIGKKQPAEAGKTRYDYAVAVTPQGDVTVNSLPISPIINMANKAGK